MIRPDTSLEDAVVEALKRIGPSSMDDLVGQLTSLGWSDVFATVDQMSRDSRCSVAFPDWATRCGSNYGMPRTGRCLCETHTYAVLCGMRLPH
jgi:hypothetical protein